MKIGFFVRHFTERGTEVAIYDYAKYNEEILNNKSYIICFTQETQKKILFPSERHSYDKFNKRFEIIEINDITEMKNIIKKYDLSFFYTLTHGGGNDIYQFNNKNIWGNCKTIKHCVFDTTYPESDFYISLSEMLNSKFNTNIPVIPHIVNLPNSDKNLRNELQIPKDAIVYGRYGGFTEFNINIAHNAIKEYIKIDPNCYFLFMNTSNFYEHPRIIYLDKNLDLNFKVKFINTCDAMIHARDIGETFGLSIGEFSIKNKPIITCNCGDLEHIKILNDKAIVYNSTEELINIFKNINFIINSRIDWSSYKLYSPEYIMNLFKNNIFDKKVILDKNDICDKKVIDCFTFYNEIDLLTYRLNLLNNVVDYFIIVEATHTHTGKEKKLYFNENKHLFEKFNKKIIHIIVDDLPHKYSNVNIINNDVWKNEIFQRNAIARGINCIKYLCNSDIIIISDLDEIPDPYTLNNIKESDKNFDITALEMDFYYYNLNTRFKDKWYKCKIISYEKYNELNITCNEIRMIERSAILNGGWHLSYFGDKHFIQNKIQNFAHQEFNNSNYTELSKIEERVRNFKDLYDRNVDIEKIQVKDNKYLPFQYHKYLINYFI
jgi:beta-1,4-mannosyl-glycoprotein beta-1,4-N-acetylglucosaminyltransferase